MTSAFCYKGKREVILILPYWVLVLFVVIKLLVLWSKKNELIRRGKAMKKYSEREHEPGFYDTDV